MPPAARIVDMHTCPMKTPGTLDNNGFARVEGIDPGTCKITFPELDEEARKSYKVIIHGKI